MLLCLAVGSLPHDAASQDHPKLSFSPAGSVIGFYQKYISDLRFSHCRFDPSCSNYGAQAIESHGLFKGTALTADRLIRCNAHAAYYHAKGSDGRLVDPADGPPAARGRPEVPRWLLPNPMDPPFPIDAVDSQLLELRSVQRRSVSDLLEYAAFADALTMKGDCWRAETEYERVAFLAQAEAVDHWALMKTGNCHYHWKEWKQSAARFQEAAELFSADADRNVAYFMAAASHFNDGRYRQSEETLQEWAVAPPARPAPPIGNPFPGATDRLGAEQVLFMRGLCAMALGDWEAGTGHFERAAAEFPDSPNGNQALFFKWKAEEAPDAVSRKSPTLAGILSIVPGMGQMYTGRYYDGFRHLVFDGLLIVSVYQLFKNEYYAAGYLLAGFTLPFYAGNIIGAKRSAEHHNEMKRAEYVARVIEEAGAQ